MTRLESVAWPLAFGAASVFALAVVLDRLPWEAAFAAVGVAVVGWAWRGPVVVGAAIGVIAWLCVTGFDVHRFGYIGSAGGGDAVRGAVLVLLGVLAGSVHATVRAMHGRRRADPVWVAFHETGAKDSHPGCSAHALRIEQRNERDG